MNTLNEKLNLSRRQLLTVFLGLSAFLALKRGKTNPEATDDTILAGRWVLKKSDVS